MDVESLAKQLILQNMTPEQQKAVLESVRATLLEARGKQKQRVSENVGMVVDALKKIEADIRAKYDDLGNKITARVNSIRDGRDGTNGSDGRDGQDGRPGRDGAPGPAGPAGRDGSNGIDGKDGVSVTDAKIDFDGSLIISLSNGREINVGEVVAPDLADRIKVITNGGGTSQTVLDTLTSLQSQIDALGDLVYDGTWNASSNTPTLTSSVGDSGHYYIVSVAGTTNLNGITDWQPGDWVIFNGTEWQKIDQSWATAGINNNITAMTGITGGISSPDFVQFDTTATVTSAVGKLYYDDGNGSLSFGLKGGATELQVGQENVVLVYNATASTITPGQVVAVNGAQGQRPSVVLADASTEALSAPTLGVAAESIAAGAEGFICTFGVVRGIDTSAFTAGDDVYLSETTGAFTATRPAAPAHTVFLGWVIKVNASSGELFVNINNGWELNELHNVLISSAASGNTLIYDASVGVWKNANLTDGTGITITEGAGSITITNSAPDQTVALTGAGTTSVTGTYPNFTITSNDQYVGTVTSVGGTGTVNGISLSGTVTSSGNLTLGGTLSGVSLTTQVSGILPIANGGTGQTTANAAFNAFAPSQTGNSGKYLTTDGTNTSWATVSSVGTVTSVGQTFTGGLISVSGSPVTSSGTLALTVAGTSGGIPYFSGTSTWASSAALASNALVIGGGAGAAPSTITTGTGVVTALGVNTGASGAFVVNGGALGTPSSGTVTNLTGTASININGTVGATTANTGAFTTLSATGVTTVQAGTVSAPAITTSGDTNTGIYFPAANQVAITTDGSQRLLVDASGDVKLSTAGANILNSSGRAILNQTGSVLQVVQNSTEGSSSTTSTTFVDVTNLTVTITPSSTSSTILVLASGRLTNTLVASTNPTYHQRLLRGSTTLSDRYLSADSSSGGLQAKGSLSFTYYDSPATTSATTYKIQHRSTSTSSTGTCDNAWIIAMEIAG